MSTFGIKSPEGAALARDKFEQLFTKGRAQAAQAIGQLMADVPQDRIVPGPQLAFAVDDNHQLRMRAGTEGVQALHRHALLQMLDKGEVSVPGRFADALMATTWGPESLANMLTHNYQAETKKKFLVRSVKGEVRGFLSDRFRRLDSAPIIESFVGALNAYGAVPVEARLLATKFYIKALIPRAYEPVANEIVALGMSLENSDFGDGPLTLRAFFMRLACLNGMMAEDALRRIHLGGRLDENLALSQRTYDLDTETMTSAVTDISKLILAPEAIDERMRLIAAKAVETIDADGSIIALQKASKLTKDEAEQVRGIFTSADIVNLPAGQSTWRLSNALSLLAHQLDDPHRSLDMETLAGEVMSAA
jgi:hypothetical protein